ncbi:hypothetical protein D3C75_1026550 [compost metagenome]
MDAAGHKAQLFCTGGCRNLHTFRDFADQEAACPGDKPIGGDTRLVVGNISRNIVGVNALSRC